MLRKELSGRTFQRKVSFVSVMGIGSLLMLNWQTQFIKV